MPGRSNAPTWYIGPAIAVRSAALMPNSATCPIVFQ